MKYLYGLTCLAVIAALGLLVFYGTLSPCEIAKHKIRNYIMAEATSDGDSFSAVLGAALSNGMAESYLHQLLEGDIRPSRCARLVWRLETPDDKGAAPREQQLSSDRRSRTSPQAKIVKAARLCTTSISSLETVEPYPAHLLAAIATTESGRWHEGVGLSLPWPWTVTIHSKKTYFDSKEEAIAFIEELEAREALATNPDLYVGCMQINLKSRPKTKQDLQQAFDPSTNVVWAATLLRDKYLQTRDWKNAVSMYDSSTGLSGQKYVFLVEKNKRRILNRVRDAQSSQGFKP